MNDGDILNLLPMATISRGSRTERWTALITNLKQYTIIYQNWQSAYATASSTDDRKSAEVEMFMMVVAEVVEKMENINPPVIQI